MHIHIYKTQSVYDLRQSIPALQAQVQWVMGRKMLWCRVIMQPHDWSCGNLAVLSALRTQSSLLGTLPNHHPCTLFSVSHFPRLRLSLTGWLCDAKFGLCMWPAPATGKPQSNFQPRAPFATQPAIFQLLCAPHRTTPQRTESVVEGRTFSVVFHVRWQRVFH